MIKQINIIKIMGLACLFFIGTGFKSVDSKVDSSFALTGTIKVIVNKDNPISGLDAVQAKLYFLRKVKSRWPQINKNIKPVERKGNPASRQTFLSNVLKMSGADVERYFMEKQYQKAIPLPAKVSSDQEVINYVKNNVGAIGYVEVGTATSDVKVLFEI